MKVCNGNMGTASHVEYLHMKENDIRRDKRRCIYYHSDKSYCGKNFGKCVGSSHCKKYTEKTRTVRPGASIYEPTWQERIEKRRKQIEKDRKRVMKLDGKYKNNEITDYTKRFFGRKNTPKVMINVVPNKLFNEWCKLADDDKEHRVFEKYMFSPVSNKGKGRMPISFMVLQSGKECIDAGSMYMSQESIEKAVGYIKDTNTLVRRMEKITGFRAAKIMEFQELTQKMEAE